MKKNLDGPINNKMLQVSLNTISAENCDKKYLSIDNRIGKLSQGIVDDSMVCTKCNEKYGKTFCKVIIFIFLQIQLHFCIKHILNII